MVFIGTRKAVAAALAVGVIVGGGLTVVAPAVASQDASYAATNWKKIWKKKLQKYADKRYYTKKQSNAKYSTKTETSTLLGNYYTKAQSDANYYTKAQSDAAYAPKTQSYTKAESDAKYAPFPALIRGTYAMEDSAGPAQLDSPISYGVSLSAVPTPHFIAAGAAVPAGCSGTASAPNAAPGHLCIFESLVNNVSVRSVVFQGTFGAVAYVTPTTGGSAMWSIGSWAVRPAALGTLPSLKAPGGGVNGEVPPQGGQRSSAAH